MNLTRTLKTKLTIWLHFCLAVPALAEVPANVQIVVLGEVHDNPDAHLGQAEVLRELRPRAVVFEMLSERDAQSANAGRSAILDIWANMFWPDFTIYEPIFEALGEAEIIGAAAPRSEIRSVFDKGAASVFGPKAAKFGLEIDLPKTQQAKREAMQFLAHCKAMPLELMSGMVEVQRFRDARFAKTALDALERYGPPIAVITGNGHGRTDWGIPAFVRQAAPDVVVFSIAFAEVSGEAPFDEVRIVPETIRPDPCEPLKNP